MRGVGRAEQKAERRCCFVIYEKKRFVPLKFLFTLQVYDVSLQKRNYHNFPLSLQEREAGLGRMASGVVGIQRVTGEKMQDARALRKNMTPTEALLWARLRNRKCGGFKFRRQQIIEGFIADYYCEQAQLVVEVDGGIHSDLDVKKNDDHREIVFKARGIKTIRFMNDAVKHNIDFVITRVIAICEKNRMKSKLSEWEKRRCINSDSSFHSEKDAGLKEKVN